MLRASSGRVRAAWTVGGTVSHIGAAVLLIGLVGLVTFVHKQTDVLLVKDLPQTVLDGQYSMTYLGQTGDFTTDRNNDLRFAVTSKDGKEHFTASMPFALRAMEGGDKKLIGHPSITHHVGGDLYLALKDGPDEFYPRGRTPLTIKMGDTHQWGPYTLSFIKFERDPQAAAMAMSGVMPARFPVWADMSVTYQGKTYLRQAPEHHPPGQPAGAAVAGDHPARRRAARVRQDERRQCRPEQPQCRGDGRERLLCHPASRGRSWRRSRSTSRPAR